jgi:hypothetical protein
MGLRTADPEQLGFGLQRMLPSRLRHDFQDFPAWRQGVYEVLDLILRSADGPVIAPMTLIEPEYFADIIGRLTDAGYDVRHFALLADARIIERRPQPAGYSRAPANGWSRYVEVLRHGWSAIVLPKHPRSSQHLKQERTWPVAASWLHPLTRSNTILRYSCCLVYADDASYALRIMSRSAAVLGRPCRSDHRGCRQSRWQRG